MRADAPINRARTSPTGRAAALLVPLVAALGAGAAGCVRPIACDLDPPRALARTPRAEPEPPLAERRAAEAGATIGSSAAPAAAERAAP